MPARRRHFSSDDDHSESINMAMNDGKSRPSPKVFIIIFWTKNDLIERVAFWQ